MSADSKLLLLAIQFINLAPELDGNRVVRYDSFA